MTKPTYTLDEVYEEAKKFAAKNDLQITSKKGLPKGKCGDTEECVLANLFGGSVVLGDELGMSDQYAVAANVLGNYREIGIDSEILERFVTDFDNKLYPELIS